MNNYCRRLKTVRSELGVSQRKMADMLQIPFGTYRRYESGNNDIPAGVLLNVSQLGYNVDWLLTGEGKMRKGENTYLASESKIIYNHPSRDHRIQELEEKYEHLRNALKKINDILSEHKVCSNLISESEPAQSK